MDPTHELAQLRLGFVDPLPGRYEVIRPLVLLGDGTITQRAQEIRPDPKAVRQEVDRLKTLEVISIYASLASSALGHRGLQHFHRNTGFARFCGYFQINRDNLK